MGTLMEARLFPEGMIPEYTTPAWYAGREAAPHLEQEGHRERLLLTAAMVNEAIGMGAQSVCDLGAGDGGLLSLLPALTPKWGYDLQQSNVNAAVARDMTVWFVNVVNDRAITWGDCVVAAEFLEHLVDPHLMVRRIHESDARWLVASSPYTETADSHYVFHTWAWDLAGYRKLLEDNGWWVVRQETAWISQVLLAVKK